jgi:hypothetical protein
MLPKEKHVVLPHLKKAKLFCIRETVNQLKALRSNASVRVCARRVPPFFPFPPPSHPSFPPVSVLVTPEVFTSLDVTHWMPIFDSLVFLYFFPNAKFPEK